ncbi:MAG: hypothetical protein KBC44_01915 [Candidatus Pacebacteria bacterium]|nr:hypothetical protein [Candidatus Paceibacterota bacterium]MBP9839718.1 hypothetical protein [Candidatus Paceibacterota bacterium]MDQ5922339.1 hypothetical protein [Patescibacteria group bacterium]
MSPAFKKVLIVVVAIGAIVLVIVLATQPKDPEGSLVSSSDPLTANMAIGGSDATTGEFLTKLLNIKNIELNDGVFSEPSFSTLRDSSILLIQDGTEGRPNPFAPIGFEDGFIPPASTTSSELNN